VIGWSGSYIRPAAPTGPAPAATGGQVQCKTPQRASHSQGHTRRRQLQPGIITEPPGSLTVIPDPLLREGLAILEQAFADLGHPVSRAPSTVIETPA
jgi:hypothetical protein